MSTGKETDNQLCSKHNNIEFCIVFIGMCMMQAVVFYEKHEPLFVFKSLTVKGSSCHGFFDEWMV